MYKKTMMAFVATAALGGVMLTSTTAFADDSSTNMTTDGAIKFFDTNKPGVGPFENNLALAYVPMQFDFGNHDVSGVTNAVTYKQNLAVGKNQYLAVSDDRSSKLKGWKVVATASDFVSNKSTEETPDKLSAELVFKVGANQKYKMDPIQSDEQGFPTPGITESGALEELGADEAGLYGIAADTFITLEAGGAAQNVLTFSTEQEHADYLGVARGISSVQLKVKDHSNVANKKYTGTVNWVLSEDV